MKALSINPEAVMDIFMGEKPIEYRTWRTDYRGDLLICASSQKQAGLVSGYAYMVVSLLDIRLSQEDWGEGYSKMYEWMLGAPKLIKPIPVKGKLHLYDVDDALIQYIDGGDLGAFPTGEQANEFRKAFARDYLEPLSYRPKKSVTFGGFCGSALKLKVQPEPPKPLVDMPIQNLLDAVLLLDPLPSLTVKISQSHPELEMGMARYPSQKAGVTKWLQGLIKRKKTSAREAYNDKRNLLSLIWLAETLGENGNKLKKTLEAVMAFNNMPERCEAFRRAIPIDRIKELVDNSKGWRIDPVLKTYIDFSDDSLMPNISTSRRNDYCLVLRQEGILLD